MVDALLTREGTVFTGTVLKDEKGKPCYKLTTKCHRCGGGGGSDAWKFTGWTCFQCGGSGLGSTTYPKLYTAAQLEKLNASKAKRDVKVQERRDAKAAANAARIAQNEVDFNTANADLLAALTKFNLFERPIIADIVRNGRHFGACSAAQMSVLTNAVAGAEKAAAAPVSNYVGTVGERLKVKVTVARKGSFERPVYGRYNMDETVWVVTMVDEQGNNIVSKSPNFNEEVGDTFILSGTVKEHADYKGTKQTVVNRCKRTELPPVPTGRAAGFRKIAE